MFPDASTREKDAASAFGETLPERAILFCDDPYAFFAFASQILYPVPRTPGVSPQAWVEEGAEVDPTAEVAPFAVVRRGAKVGANVLVSSGVYIGENASVGDDTVIYPNAVLYADTVVGRGCTIQSCAVLGGDGFGFAPFRGEWVKIPQRGRTVLGDDVEIGASTTVDRGALDDTTVGDGTKIDNQIQRKYFREFPYRIQPFFEFGLRRNIGIGKEKRKLSPRFLQHSKTARRARSTADMQQKFFLLLKIFRYTGIFHLYFLSA